MRKPGFFILGAPKCGTTSLAAWLAQHPRIYMSPLKEPHFFNTDEGYVVTPTLERYERLFEGATEAHSAVGEASVWYLHSREAVPSICKYVKHPRFIVCLRNPVDMAYSLHGEQVLSGHEHVTRFEEAWKLQNRRLRGEAVKGVCPEPRHLAYGAACALGAQLDRLYQTVARASVLTVVLDDLKENPKGEYSSVLQFLGVDDDDRRDFRVHNVAKEHRSPLVRKAIRIAGRAKRTLGIRAGLGVLNRLDQANVRSRPRAPLARELRRELQEYFRTDVEHLGQLLDRDLSAWLQS